MTRRIDWEALAQQLDLLDDGPDGRQGEHSSRDAARIVLERIVGEDEICAAVDYYVSGGRGSELARSVLWLLRPGSAMQRCRDISTRSTDRQERRAAVELLRVVADGRALPWVADYLDDEDEGVQSWGIGILSQLLYENMVEREAAEDLLRRADDHPSPMVRETAAEIRWFLREADPAGTG